MNFKSIKITLIAALIAFKISKANAQLTGIIFTNAKGEVATTFEAGEEMYGKVILPKPLKDYVKGESVKQIRFDLKSTSNDGSGTPIVKMLISVTKLLRASEFSKPYIEFDIYPSLQKAKDIYESGVGFFFPLYPTNSFEKGIVKYEVSIGDEYNDNYNGLSKMEVSGEFSLDYTKVTETQYKTLWGKGRDAHSAAEENTDKIIAQENAELVKSMSLPIVFTKPSKAGYIGYSNAVIINMIKARYKIANVYMLTFGEPEGTGDFTSLKDLNNYPSEKSGNHVFYFAFKDEIDGQYKFAGGRLRMLYEGNGKYSEAFIFPYSPIMNGDAKFPYDYGRHKMGFESVFFMDGAKIKK